LFTAYTEAALEIKWFSIQFFSTSKNGSVLRKEMLIKRKLNIFAQSLSAYPLNPCFTYSYYSGALINQVSSSSPADCQSKCQVDSNCVAFYFDIGSSQCFLHWAKASSDYCNNAVVSGPKNC